MKKSKKNYVIIGLLVLLIAIAVGYAAFQSILNISGTATGTAKWDVKFTAAGLYDSTGAADTGHGTVSISANGLTVDATDIQLAYPGDAVKLKTTITNAGTLDAKLTSITVNKAGLENTDITVTEAVPTQNEVISANGGTCTSEYVVQWDPLSTKTSTVGSFSVSFTYDQDTNTISITPAHNDTTP